MEAAPSSQHPNDDFYSAIIAQFSDPSNEHHLQICASVGAISQQLIHLSISRTAIAYLGSTCSSLDRVERGDLFEDPNALLTILSLLTDRVPPTALKMKYDYLSELLIRVLRLKSVGVDGVVPGLECILRLLIVRDKIVWEDVAELYGVLVSYITDDRPKVRKQSQTCLCEVLEYFQLAPVLAPLLEPASEAITNVLENKLIAGGSNGNSSEAPKRAKDILYILDALKICLPYMSSKSSTNILQYFKSLLELRHPMVTRRISDGLYALCLHPVGEFPAEVLLDLLCLLATSVSLDEPSADSMTLIARLLDNGMKKVYSLNRQICVAKLPVVFSALKDILASEHKEAWVAATATFKSLIHSCVDADLIKQGVDQLEVSANTALRKSSPTIIEKVCASIESLLSYHYGAVWDMAFQIVSTMFCKLGKHSSYFLKGTLKSLVDLQKLPTEDPTFREQLDKCIKTARGAMGPEAFPSGHPLNSEVREVPNKEVEKNDEIKKESLGAPTDKNP